MRDATATATVVAAVSSSYPLTARSRSHHVCVGTERSPGGNAEHRVLPNERSANHVLVFRCEFYRCQYGVPSAAALFVTRTALDPSGFIR